MKSGKTSKGKRSAAAVAVAPAQASKPAVWPYALALVLGLFLIFEIYQPALNGPFMLDDTYLPYALPSYANAPLSVWLQGLRPLLMLSFWLNFQHSGSQDLFGYHAVNVLLHFASSVLIYLAIRGILQWASVTQPKLEILSVFAAGLFLLHPIQTETVAYIASRSDGLSVFFILAAFVVFLYRKNQSISAIAAALVFVLFGAACLSKEHAVVLPALLLLTDYYWNPGFSFSGIRRNWKLYAPMAIGAVLGAAYVFRILAVARSAGFGLKDLTWYQYFFTECRAIWVYARMYALPYGQNIDYDFPASHTLVEHGAILGLVALLVVIALAWIYRKRFPLESYGVLTFLLLLAPTSSFVPIQDPLVEHRLYLPFIGLLIVTVGLLRRWSASRNMLIGALAAVLVVAGWLTYQRNQFWSDTIVMWKDSVAKSPHKLRPGFQLADAYYFSGRCQESLPEFSRTAQLDPRNAYLLINWGLAYDCVGNHDEALAKLKQAAALQPTAHVNTQIAKIYAEQGKYAEAIPFLDTAQKMDPNFAVTYFYRGNIDREQGDNAKAADEYHRALAIDPQYEAAREALLQIGR